jgi:hypothetical protein
MLYSIHTSSLTILLAFATEVEALLSEPTGPRISASLVDKLENHIQTFPANVGSAASAKYEDLDRSGTTLWNLCTRLKRSDEPNNQQKPLVLAMTRLYAFLMLDSGQNSGKGNFTNGVRVMKVALKTAKNCLGATDFPYANLLYFLTITAADDA